MPQASELARLALAASAASECVTMAAEFGSVAELLPMAWFQKLDAEYGRGNGPFASLVRTPRP